MCHVRKLIVLHEKNIIYFVPKFAICTYYHQQVNISNKNKQTCVKKAFAEALKVIDKPSNFIN